MKYKSKQYTITIEDTQGRQAVFYVTKELLELGARPDIFIGGTALKAIETLDASDSDEVLYGKIFGS